MNVAPVRRNSATGNTPSPHQSQQPMAKRPAFYYHELRRGKGHSSLTKRCPTTEQATVHGNSSTALVCEAQRRATESNHSLLSGMTECCPVSGKSFWDFTWVDVLWNPRSLDHHRLSVDNCIQSLAKQVRTLHCTGRLRGWIFFAIYTSTAHAQGIAWNGGLLATSLFLRVLCFGRIRGNTATTRSNCRPDSFFRRRARPWCSKSKRSCAAGSGRQHHLSVAMSTTQSDCLQTWNSLSVECSLRSCERSLRVHHRRTS